MERKKRSQGAITGEQGYAATLASAVPNQVGAIQLVHGSSGTTWNWYDCSLAIFPCAREDSFWPAEAFCRPDASGRPAAAVRV